MDSVTVVGAEPQQDPKTKKPNGKICFNYVVGRCLYGDDCRFSHDPDEFFKSREPDLPGSCPYSLMTYACPYGPTCRWAASHLTKDATVPVPSPVQQKYDALAEQLKHMQTAIQHGIIGLRNLIYAKYEPPKACKQPPTQGIFSPVPSTYPTDTAATPTPPAVPAVTTGHPVEESEVKDGGKAAAPDGGAPVGDPVGDGASGAVEGQVPPAQPADPGGPSTSAAPHTDAEAVAKALQLPGPETAANGGGAKQGDAGLLDVTSEYQGQSILGRVHTTSLSWDPAPAATPAALHIPVQTHVDAELNRLNKDLQGMLRRKEFDFARAKAVLKDLNEKDKLAKYDGRRVPKRGREWDDVDRANGKVEAKAQKAEAKVVKAEQQEEDGAAADTEHEPYEAAEEKEPSSEAGPSDTVMALPDDSPTQDEANDASAPVVPPPPHDRSGEAPPRSLLGPPPAPPRVKRVSVRYRHEDKPPLDMRGQLYLAPLTTVGNLPFRRLCVQMGADITCGEMAVAGNLLQGQASEWALLQRHPCERVFGAQIASGFPDQMARVGQLLDDSGVQLDFLDLNCGCPIDLIVNKGAGAALLLKPQRLMSGLRALDMTLYCPITVKCRKGYYDKQDVVASYIPQLLGAGAAVVSLHGRSRQQRYSKKADWRYVQQCASSAPRETPDGACHVVGNGDIFAYTDYAAQVGLQRYENYVNHVYAHPKYRPSKLLVDPEANTMSLLPHGQDQLQDTKQMMTSFREGVGGSEASVWAGDGEDFGLVDTCMLARGALIKPWIFTEIKEGRHWDISATERLDLLRTFVSCGLTHWGSDSKGVATTRRFLLELLSYTHRYVPVPLLDVVPQHMQWRPCAYFSRNWLEGLLASESAHDWLRITELLLGPVPNGFTFTPKHKSNAYSTEG